MDPLRIAIRAASAYIVLLVLMRLTGKRTISHSSPFDLAVALIIGDLVDKAILVEVPFVQFLAAVVSLTTVHIAFDVWRYRAGGSVARN